jgi:metal-responsive CopG/Arc/MetJ family transcriptional regulator
MVHEDIVVSLKIPAGLVEKLDTIAKQKFLNREDVIIDACAYYCQFHDMNSERFPETMRSVFFNLARHDDEFRTLLRQVVKDNPATDSNNNK